MQTREVPDFWGLHKNTNCVFPLKELRNYKRKLFLRPPKKQAKIQPTV